MLCETVDHIQDPAIAESLAARRGVELGLSLGLRKIILEGDALEIVGVLNKEGVSYGKYGQVLNDTKFQLGRFQKYVVRHVGREINRAAHALAKLALSLGSNRLWREDFPSCLDALVALVCSVC
jgi:hypothetical protein